MTVRVDLEAIRNNLKVIRSLAGERSVMACIKGNAYGHGLVPVARCLERLRPALVEITTVVGSVRTISAGERFGPGGVRTAARATRVGVLPLGFSNSILVRKPGQRVGVAGRSAAILSVSLEHTVVDLTDAMPVGEHATVHLLARDATAGPTLDEVARAQDRVVALTGKAGYAYGS